MGISIIAGQQYTFGFTPSGIDLSGPFTDQGSSVVASLQKAGYPISNVSWTQAGLALGYLGVSDIEVSFQYNGNDTDSDTLGEAMAAELTGDFSTASFTFSGAQAGNVAASGSATDDLNKVKAALPSPSTIGIAALIIFVLGIAVYSFAGAAGSKLA